MIVLVMLALLVEPAAADGIFRLSGFLMLERSCGSGSSEFIVELPLVGEIRHSLQHTKLLLVRFAALRSRARAARAIFPGRLPAVVYFRLVDTALRVGVILDVAFDGIFTGKLLQV